MPSRREFLAELAGATAGVFFVSCGLSGRAEVGQQQAPGPVSTLARREVRVGGRRVRTVDTHAHCIIADGWDLVKNFEQAKAAQAQFSSPDGPKMLLPDVGYRLKQMDQQGIDVQAVSLSTPQLHYWAERDLASQIVRIQNEKLAALCAAHPDRFVALGNAAIQHPDLAVEQMDYAVKKLGMRGFEIGGSVNGEEISSPKFHPFWRKAEDLGILIFIHPAGFPEAARRLQGNGKLDNIIANPLETTVALSHLIFEGTLDLFPGVKICAAHGGGFLASYIGRSDHCVDYDSACKPVKKHPSEYLNRLYFDSIVYTPEALRHLIAQVGAERILMGTDFPFAMGDFDAVDHLLNAPGASDLQRQAMLGGTASKLLGIPD